MNVKKYLGEGLLIVFSVLFALFINKSYQDAKTNSDKNNAMIQIKAELLDNQNTLKDWMANHKAIIENIDILLDSKIDSIQIIAKNKSYIPVQTILDNKPIISYPLSNSAWRSAQSIGIISEFDFQTLKSINETYELQQIIMGASIEKIAERFLLESTAIENTKALMIEQRLRFQNLLGQEIRLEHLYKETIAILE